MSKKEKNTNPSAMLAELAIKGIQEKKGKDIVCLDLRNIAHAVTDYFIICHAESNTQVDAIANSVDDEIKKATGENPWHTEGFENAEWILIDYVNVVVHVFQKETRDFYSLEKLWADAEQINVPDDEAPSISVN
jgi:ribosome-associated protein